jgi:hypothetical protein
MAAILCNPGYLHGDGMTDTIEVKLARLEEKIDNLLRLSRANETAIKANEIEMRAEVKELAGRLAELEQSISKIWGGVAAIASLISVIMWLVNRMVGQ